MAQFTGQNSFTRTMDKSLRIVEMQKAMASQQLGTLGISAGPGQLGVQSLEGQLYILTYGDSEFKILQDLQKVPAFNWIHEFNVLQNYGSSVGAAIGAGALPPVNNSYFKRGWAEIKFYGDYRAIPQQLLEIESAVGNYVGVETRNSLMSLMGKINHQIYWGDSSLNQYQFDGINKQVPAQFPGNIIDARGGNLTPGILEQAALQVRNNWGNPAFCNFYCDPAVITPFTLAYIPNQRAIPMLWEGTAGNPFAAWDTQYGRIKLRDDRFTEREPFVGTSPIQALSYVPQGLPPTPTAAPTVAAPASDASSQFTAGGSGVPATPGGYFSYAYAYKNSVGLGMVSPASTPVNIQNGQSAQLTIPTAGVNPAPQSIVIYRSNGAVPGTSSSYAGAAATFTPNLANFQIMTEIPAVISTNGTTYTDENANLPGTYTGFLVNTTKDGMHLAKLGDVQKMELAPVTLAYQFLSIWYGCLIVPAAQWSVLVRNLAGGNGTTVPVNAAYAA